MNASAIGAGVASAVSSLLMPSHSRTWRAQTPDGCIGHKGMRYARGTTLRRDGRPTPADESTDSMVGTSEAAGPSGESKTKTREMPAALAVETCAANMASSALIASHADAPSKAGANSPSSKDRTSFRPE